MKNTKALGPNSIHVGKDYWILQSYSAFSEMHYMLDPMPITITASTLKKF